MKKVLCLVFAAVFVLLCGCNSAKNQKKEKIYETLTDQEFEMVKKADNKELTLSLKGDPKGKYEWKFFLSDSKVIKVTEEKNQEQNTMEYVIKPLKKGVCEVTFIYKKESDIDASLVAKIKYGVNADKKIVEISRGGTYF